MKNDKQQPEKMKAIKKPIPVEFVKLEKTPQSVIEVYRFINGPESVKLTCNAAHDAWDNYSDDLMSKGYMPLKTLESGEGAQNANFGDYILKGIDGECWPVKADIFERTYDVQAPLSNENKVAESEPFKTAEEFIKTIYVNAANFNHIASTETINGSLYTEIKRVMEAYASQFKNTDAVKVITEEIVRLKAVSKKYPRYKSHTNYSINILHSLLTKLQS